MRTRQLDEEKGIIRSIAKLYLTSVSMATETKSSVVRVKQSHQDGSSKAKVDSSSANKKKIESSNKQPIDSKQKSVTTLLNTEVPISNFVALCFGVVYLCNFYLRMMFLLISPSMWRILGIS